MSLRTYPLSGATVEAFLDVDLGRGVAGWRVDGRDVPAADLRGIAAPSEIERVVRRAVADVRQQASVSRTPAAETLRGLAADLWRTHRHLVQAGAGQDELPGLADER